MDGLECSEISYKNIISNNDVFRFDSEYFKKESVALINTIYNRNYDLIGNHFDVSKLAGFEYTKYFTEENMSSNNVYIAITSKNVKSERLLLDDVLTIDKTIADEYLGRSKLKPKDVVLSYTGEYRRALTLEINNVQLGPNVCRLTPKDNAINSYYLSSFLNCPVGQKILDKEKTLSAQPTVAMSRIRNIPIPLLSNKFQNIIEEIIRWANISILEADNKYSTAKAILFNELNYRPDEICRDSIAIKFLSQINTTDKRIDAEFYL